MATTKVQVDERHERLMLALRDTVQGFTQQVPMTHESIVACMAFTLGAAIGQGKTRGERHQLRQMANANVDFGTTTFSGQPVSSSIILPGQMN